MLEAWTSFLIKFSIPIFFFPTDMCNLSDNIYDYYNVSQGKVTIPNMDDGEEFALTDVSVSHTSLSKKPCSEWNATTFTSSWMNH